jgi:hypothetical protein
MPKLKAKTAILSFRVEPRVRTALERAAEAERRSLANMAEILILEGCERRGLPTATPASPKRPTKSKP